MNQGFVQIGSSHAGIGGENSFWPSFTDVMMVITLIFLMATSILVVRNWQLVAELQQSIAAEAMATELIQSTELENATLEERLANAEQANSILRLRLMKKDEELATAQAALRDQEISTLESQRETRELEALLEQTRAELDAANLEINAATAQFNEMAAQIAALSEQLARQQLADDQTRAELETARGEIESARGEIAALTASSSQQQQAISELTSERDQLNFDISAYNQQLLTLKGEYETVKSAYEELIKPARSPKGKYIASVYYIKGENGNLIRYREPGDTDFSTLSLAEVEQRLDAAKQKHGKNLYVKIIIPEDSGLAYNEAWEFMRNLLVKYDYYYQD